MNHKFKVTGKKDTYIIFDTVLGKGAYAVVYYAESVKSKQRLAGFQISKSSLSPTDIVNLRNEVKNQQPLTHPNIVQMVDAFEDNHYLYLILEYCSGGCLYQKILLNGPLREEMALRYFVQAVEAIHYIHGQGILHRDVKLSNLLLASDGSIKLADFTWSVKLQNGYSLPQLCGTLEYMPPEVHCFGMQNKKLDIWSLGITLYEMLHSDRPKNGTLILKPGLSVECKSLIKSMLEVETQKRPSTTDLLQSAWVKNYNSQSNGLSISISSKLKTQSATQFKKCYQSQSPIRNNSPLCIVYGVSSGANNGSGPSNSPLTKRNQYKRYSKNPSQEKIIYSVNQNQQ